MPRKRITSQRRTLDRLLSRAGIGSRSEARGFIEEGRVSVNGAVVREANTWVDLEHDQVSFDGAPLQEEVRRYVAFHKPRGYVTTRRDPDGRPTVYDLIPERYRSLSPVGRLDRDTSGLLVFTNDHDFASRLTDPGSHLAKTYLVKVSSFLTDTQIDQLRRGVVLRDGPTRPAVVSRLRNPGGKTVLEMQITEGRNRQIRRMMEAVGAKVITLTRIAIGSLQLGDLASGKCRELSSDEIRLLEKCV